MDLNLSGRVAVITGASKGIGRAIAQVLSAEGMKLILVARSGGLLDELSISLASPCLPLAVDLRQSNSARLVVKAAIEKFGRLDLLVNNAGTTKRGDFMSLSPGDWTEGFGLKFFGAVHLSREAWHHLKDSRGSIVNIIGVGGRTGSAEFAVGGAVNAALMNLTKVLADRGVREGVRVNAVNPGSIETERLQKRIDSLASEMNLSREEAADQMTRRLGISRFGEPQEIARVVAFLASPQAAYIQGAILDVDGGATRSL